MREPNAGRAALAQVTSDAAEEGEIRANRRQRPVGTGWSLTSRYARTLVRHGMRLVWSDYGTVPRGTTHRAGCPVILAIRS